jgi:hypothetical protein
MQRNETGPVAASRKSASLFEAPRIASFKGQLQMNHRETEAQRKQKVKSVLRQLLPNKSPMPAAIAILAQFIE